MSSGTRVAQPIETEVFQTNDFDKYDLIYNGFVEGNSDSFRPTVTLTPSAGQDGGFQIVAQRVRFELLSSTGGLNGLYEFNPNEAVANTDFSASKVDEAGMNLTIGAQINQVAVQDGTTYVAGNFTATDFTNIFALEDNSATALPGGGLNGEISSLYLNGTSLFVGGNFTDTNNTDTEGLSNIAIYSIPDQTWVPLGAGVNGKVSKIVPILFNVTTNQPENVVAVTGDFDQVLPFGDTDGSAVQGLAIWVPSRQNWLQIFGSDSPSIKGQVTASANVPGGNTLYAGTLASAGRSANGAVTLATSEELAINNLPVKIEPQQVQQSTNAKRAISGQNITGVVTGLFYENDGRNVTILGGHFTAQGSNGSEVSNLLFINGTNGDDVTGVGSGLDIDAVFLALAVQEDTLYAGGTIRGTVGGEDVNGLILYDLARGDYVATQPPAFAGDSVAVNAIATQPNTGNVYVAGDFQTAGSLDCPTVCFFSTQSSQWNRPGIGLGGSVGAMAWSENEKLVVGGNLTLNGSATTMAMYDSKVRAWSTLPGGDQVPGPVTALSAADDTMSQFWVAGASTNGSAFLMKYDGSKWQSVGDTLGTTTRIRGIQVLSLSEDHEENDLVDQDQTLLITGQLSLPNFGNASSALFNGTTFSPFILSNSGNDPGSLSQIFSQRPISFAGRRKFSACSILTQRDLG